jgi:2-polyprenyl-3-methyl-5-hydroxy-6-metoxy-1,4-benzoquinol methylase
MRECAAWVLMSQADRKKWDRRDREGAYLERVRPAELLVEWLPRLRQGTALDLACGAGRNALFLAQSGFSVDAVDISPVALERARASADSLGVIVNWLQADLDSDSLPT